MAAGNYWLTSPPVITTVSGTNYIHQMTPQYISFSNPSYQAASFGRNAGYAGSSYRHHSLYHIESAGSLWSSLVSASGLLDLHQFSDLRDAYAGRAYHNLDHIALMLYACIVMERPGADGDDLLDGLSPDFHAIRWAIWYHDIVYDSRRDDNEQQSAAYARKCLQEMGAGRRLVDEVERLILLTGEWFASPPRDDDVNGHILLDCDLSILSSTEKEYALYMNAVRAEFAHVSQDDYERGRARILRDILAMPRIYSFFPPANERVARRNIQTELDALKEKP